ncbi:MAG: type II toxin-antitoxin system death-on-curing family toxin [Verrucomicrobiota bacterium]
MTEPIWLPQVAIHSIHNELLNRFGGSTGIRDEGLLDSALARPVQLFHYGKPTLFECAASYAHGIVKNHPFIDGNKRTGFIAAALFLELNGYHFTSSEADAVLQTLALAAGEIQEAEFADWLSKSCSVNDPE